MHLLKQYAPFEKCDVISHMIIKTAHKFVFFLLPKLCLKSTKVFYTFPALFCIYIFFILLILFYLMFVIICCMLIIFVVVLSVLFTDYYVLQYFMLNVL